MKTFRLLLFTLFALFHSMSSIASIDVYEFESEALRADFVSLTKELRCPKCQNQDIADSNAPIAADMRKEVHRLLNEGKSKESIVNYMIERFGDFVTYKPKKSLQTFMLWYGPWIFIAIGLCIIGSLFRKKKQVSGPETSIHNDAQSILDTYEDKDK